MERVLVTLKELREQEVGKRSNEGERASML